MRKNVAVIGGGIAGLAAAYDLLRVGHNVTIFEAGPATGGLARGFRDDKWDWPLEHFYHHLFQSDKEIIHLAQELGIHDMLFFPKPQTSFYYEGRIYPFDNIGAFFKFPGFGFFNTLRFGAVTAVLRYTRLWRLLERVTADKWMRRWYGSTVYEASWRPALINKFGRYFDQVPMSWMWARVYARSFRLGYFEGGFATFVEALTQKIQQLDGIVMVNAPVGRIEKAPTGLNVILKDGSRQTFDQVLVTTSPEILLKTVPALKALHEPYARKVEGLVSIGAVVLIAALRWPLFKNTYWLNIPGQSPDKLSNEIPYLGLVEHTNYIDNRHYGGDHIIYLGDYVPADHDYFKMSQKEIEELFLPTLKKFNPNFERGWVRKTWLFRAKYAQPVPLLNHSKNLPEIQTPLEGLYFASMSQVYPWDRGTNFAVEIGRRAARLMEKGRAER